MASAASGKPTITTHDISTHLEQSKQSEIPGNFLLDVSCTWVVPKFPLGATPLLRCKQLRRAGLSLDRAIAYDERRAGAHAW